MNELLRAILILLVIIIAAPLIFVGTCFPIGLFGFGLMDSSLTSILGYILFIGAWFIGALAVIYICKYLIKWIKKK